MAWLANVSGYTITTTTKGRKRASSSPSPATPPPPWKSWTRSARPAWEPIIRRACSPSASPDAAHEHEKQRGYQSDEASTEEAHERQREQLETLKAAAAAAAADVTPAVRRKRRVLKKLTKEPSVSPEMAAMVYVDEGNCPSDGCSIENAAPANVEEGIERLKRRGYQSEQHSTEDARERL